MDIDLCFDDVLLEPKYSSISSRELVDISCPSLGLDLPVIASPMDTVSGAKMAAAMERAGGMAIIHRYNSPEEQHQIVKESGCKKRIGIAVGLKDYSRRMMLNCEYNPVVCVDVAHGHNECVWKAIRKIKEIDGKCFVIAGNVATAAGARFLQEAGADAVRVGIGSGSICTTRVQTGHGVPLLQSLLDIKDDIRVTCPIIADGGIRNSGDAVKAFAAGAQAIMCGSLLSGTDETPGEVIINEHGDKIKVYRGMASREAQENLKNNKVVKCPEGVSSFVPYKGPVAPVLAQLAGGIRSGLSYSGAFDIRTLYCFARFRRISHHSKIEGIAHISLI